MKDYSKAYRESHKEEIMDLRNRSKKKAKAWRDLHKEGAKIKNKIWRENNKEAVKLKRKAYYKSRKEEISISGKIYRETHKKEYLARHRAYYRSHRKEALVKSSSYAKDQVDRLTDFYILARLTHNTPISRDEIPESLIQAKRSQLKLYRAIKSVCS